MPAVGLTPMQKQSRESNTRMKSWYDRIDISLKPKICVTRAIEEKTRVSIPG